MTKILRDVTWNLRRPRDIEWHFGPGRRRIFVVRKTSNTPYIRPQPAANTQGVTDNDDTQTDPAAIQRKKSICCMQIKCNIHFSSFGQQQGRETSGQQLTVIRYWPVSCCAFCPTASWDVPAGPAAAAAAGGYGGAGGYGSGRLGSTAAGGWDGAGGSAAVGGVDGTGGGGVGGWAAGSVVSVELSVQSGTSQRSGGDGGTEGRSSGSSGSSSPAPFSVSRARSAAAPSSDPSQRERSGSSPPPPSSLNVSRPGSSLGGHGTCRSTAGSASDAAAGDVRGGGGGGGVLPSLAAVGQI